MADLILRVQRTALLTPRIREVELIGADGAELPAFSAGAHIDVTLGNNEVRSYSLINAPSERNRYVIAVLREAQSTGGSAWVHDCLRNGDVLVSSAPQNNFPLNEAGEHHILIAGGIGITPILSMAARLSELRADFALHYVTRSPKETAFRELIQQQFARISTLYHDGGDPAQGINLPALLTVRPPAAHVYVCGPHGLIRATREAAKHWPKGTVHFELFNGSDMDTAPRSNDQPFEVELRKSGQILLVPADRTILDVLRSAGLKVKTLCKEGVCGTCRTRLLGGAADHRDEVLTDAERADWIQVCVSRAKPGERLILDL